MKHLDNNTWPLGISWTKGYEAIGYNPDGTVQKQWIHSGPFLFIQIDLGNRRMFESYFGFKPTPEQSPQFDVSYKNPRIVNAFIRLQNWKFKHNIGNFNCALRITGY